jgi:hypothetical protein
VPGCRAFAILPPFGSQPYIPLLPLPRSAKVSTFTYACIIPSPRPNIKLHTDPQHSHLQSRVPPHSTGTLDPRKMSAQQYYNEGPPQNYHGSPAPQGGYPQYPQQVSFTTGCAIAAMGSSRICRRSRTKTRATHRPRARQAVAVTIRREGCNTTSSRLRLRSRRATITV